MKNHDQRSPETGGEKLLVLCLVIGFLALLAFEIGHNFEPKRMGAVFFVLAWIPLLVLHEYGHAITARLFGWQINRVELGFGKAITRFRISSVPVIVRAFPLEGFVQCEPANTPYSRIHHALIFFAGPAIELILAALLLLFALDLTGEANQSILLIAIKATAYAAIAGAAINLIPFAIDSNEGVSVSDGAGIIASLLGRFDSKMSQ